MTALPRTRLGAYRLEGFLGRGGMGAVYRAVDGRLGRRVAIKHLLPATVDGEARQRRFRREARVLASLSHPAIVQIFDWIEESDGDWIVMELVEGPTVARLLEQGPLPIPQVLEIGRWVAEGIGEAHGRGILHRDLKAENLILQPSGRPKILDFGLAKGFADELEGGGPGDSTISGADQLLGTVRAMAPEQARGLALDGRSDLFSLGVLLYEMLTAESPFQGPSKIETLERILTQSHVPLRQVRRETPAELARLVDRLLEKSPDRRPASAAEVAAELAAIAAASTGPVHPPSARRIGPAPAVPGQVAADRETTDDEASGSVPEPGFSRADPGLDRAGAARSPAGDSDRRPPARRRLHPLLWASLLSAALTLAAAWAVRWQRSSQTDDPAREIEAPATAPDAHALLLAGMADLDRADLPGRPDRAIEAFEAVLGLDASSAPAHAGLALAYWWLYRQGRDPLRLEQAVAVARRAVGLDEHLALARIALGTVEAEAGRHGEALEELRRALELSPGSAEAYRGLGIAHLQQGETELAIGAFERAVAADPEDLFSRGELGMLYYRLGRYAEAEAQFVASIEAFPDSVYGHRNLSAVYFAQGRLAEAAEVLQRALMITPDPSLYSNLGTLLFAQGLYLPAARAYEKALQHGGGNVYLYWANLADAYRQARGHGDEARRAYGQAIRLVEAQLGQQPASGTLRSRLALYHAKAGACARALEVLTAAGPAPQEASEHFRRAVALEVCGRRPGALDALGSALRAGYSASEIGSDPELFDLRADPSYRRLLSESEAGGAKDPAPEVRASG